MICLDTNIVVAFLKRRDHRLAERFRAQLLGEGFALPAPVVAELWFGALNSERVEENVERITRLLTEAFAVLPLDADDARDAGAIRAHLKQAGTPIGPYDVLIAAQARRRYDGGRLQLSV